KSSRFSLRVAAGKIEYGYSRMIIAASRCGESTWVCRTVADWGPPEVGVVVGFTDQSTGTEAVKVSPLMREPGCRQPEQTEGAGVDPLTGDGVLTPASPPQAASTAPAPRRTGRRAGRRRRWLTLGKYAPTKSSGGATLAPPDRVREES